MSGTDQPTMHTQVQHPMLGRVPLCRSCGAITKRRRILSRNRNGNAGRPMYKCMRCNKFACFGDIRGVQQSNPVCFCKGNMPSRAQVSRHEEGWANSRTVHYRCASRECDFWKPIKDVDGKVVRLAVGCLDVKEAKGMGV